MNGISIVGPGRAGGAIALALSRKNISVSSLIARDPESAGRIAREMDPSPRVFAIRELRSINGETVILSVNDDSIKTVAESLARVDGWEGRTALHLSGSRGSELLESLKAKGANTGSLHPLVSISDPHIGSRRFQGSFFCVEGDPEAITISRSLADSLGGTPFEIANGMKPLYHASAVVACGHLVALLDLAFSALADCGPDKDEAKNILLPLISSTISNLKEQRTAEALTGTFARADLETFEKHIDAIHESGSDEFREIYLQLGKHSVELAKDQGADPEAIEAFRRRIEDLLR
ncbi:MAG: DUF2520 domain-containing protein [Acidobacteria bacterium]|nr:MAG: DUF2520 domain-containing protein [Acidobacteriota bacterium]REK01791.1 MAG: DUF2520 domain-containing protein [Acidobacteriota bacterium]REK14747.1 MAG: DUF2520 domain-containing protein [Acidobacteriota bacterium]REK45462.1 MAG: DUF2520 domain-containing protein [Acidobacteriota bacterium]